MSGRAGRFSEDSIVIYQTLKPNDEILKNIIENKTENFLIERIKNKKKNNLPPYFRLISLIISSDTKENSYQGALEIKKKIERLNDIEILGPVILLFLKKKKMFRTRLLIRSESKNLCQKPLVKVLEKLKISTKIKLTVDVDPINFT